MAGISMIKIFELTGGDDPRGFNFTMPASAFEFVGQVADVHVSSSMPGDVRGNHYHLQKRRAILVLPGTAWSLHWEEGECTAVESRSFDGNCAVLVFVPPLASHAVRNDGSATLWLMACSSAPYDANEVVARKVV
jgi:oxalate decarboxylase/phosphoglucose isomerase-like protein (cupin superfamily)